MIWLRMSAVARRAEPTGRTHWTVDNGPAWGQTAHHAMNMHLHSQRLVFPLVTGGMAMLILLLAAPASGADGRELGDLKIAPARVPNWMPGVDGGISQVASKIDARQAGCAGDGTHDDLPALQKAVDSVDRPGAVFLPAGTYLIRGELKLPSGVVLRGAGPEATRLIVENPKASTAAIKLRGGYEGKEIALAGGVVAGSTNLTLAIDAKPSVGQYLDLRCDNDPKVMYTRSEWDADWAKASVGQVVRVKALAGRLVTLDRPVRLEYRAEMNPRIQPLRMVERAGVEDLSIRRANDTETFIIEMWCAADCWVRNIHSVYCYRAHVWTSLVRGVTVRDSVMHHAWDYGGNGHGYGVVAGTHATDCLVENNTFFHVRHAMMTKEGANGNVFGYNASFLNYAHEGARSYGRLCDISQHGHFSYMNLFEGNVVQYVVFSDYWGPTGPQSTCYRNRVMDRGEWGPRGGIEVKEYSHTQNVMANTLLVGGIAVEANCREVWVEKNLFVKSAATGQDALTVGPGRTGWTLPASLYLAGKPAWWGDRPWPGIGADVDRAALAEGRDFSAIPAEKRYPCGLEK